MMERTSEMGRETLLSLEMYTTGSMVESIEYFHKDTAQAQRDVQLSSL